MSFLRSNLGLSKLGDSQLIDFSTDKVTRITGNAKFAGSQTSIAAVATTLPLYITAVGIQNGSKADTASKNQLRRLLCKQLSITALYCLLDANEDEAVFLESGFALSTKKSPLGIMMKPEKFNLDLGNNPGELDASMEPFRKCKGYSFAWTMDPITPASVWIVIPCPRKKCTIDGFASGAKVWVKGGAVSTDGTIVYSDPQSRIVQ